MNIYRKLERLVSKRENIQFVDPVKMSQISRKINSYDIGLFLLWPKSFSYRMALPNKIFEYIQGRLAVAIWPSPEMEKIVKKYELGVVSDNFTIASMAEKLNALKLEDIMRFKMNSHKVANDLCAEKNCEILIDVVKDLLQMEK